jgi:hypothetical protein
MSIINVAQLIDRQNNNKSDVAIEIDRLWVVGGEAHILHQFENTIT